MATVRFGPQDLTESVPAPGWYATRISSCRWRTSAAGHQMLQVVYGVEGVGADYARLAEYFVLDEGEPLAAAVSRRRLGTLYRAAGLFPKPGDPILPSDLVDAELQIEVEPQSWQGRTRLRVVRHRPPASRTRVP